MPRLRPATAAEAAEDYRKREAAIERSAAEGIYREADIERLRAQLPTFTGYPRLVTARRPRAPLSGRPRLRFGRGRRSPISGGDAA